MDQPDSGVILDVGGPACLCVALLAPPPGTGSPAQLSAVWGPEPNDIHVLLMTPKNVFSVMLGKPSTVLAQVCLALVFCGAMMR